MHTDWERNAMCPLTIESLHQNVEEQDNSIAYQKMAFEAIFWYTFFLMFIALSSVQCPGILSHNWSS